MNQKIENIPFDDVAEQSIPFELLTLQELYNRFQTHPVDLFATHRIEFNALIIITEGYGTHTIDFKEYTLSPGVLIPLVKDQVHYFERELTVKGYILSFNEAFVTDNMSEKNLFHFLHLYHTSDLLIGEENITSLLPLVEMLQQIQASTNSNLKADFIKSVFMALLIQIKRLTVYQHEAFESRRFKDFIAFKQLINTLYTESHNAKDYAEQLGVSYKYLNDICRELSGKTVKAFIDNWLLLEIKRNLSEQRYTTQEIAFKMGFQEPSNFIRFFRKFTDTTPARFAKSLTS